MPLATQIWDDQYCQKFVAAKQACWHRNGLGHWGILANDIYVGWGGIQQLGAQRAGKVKNEGITFLKFTLATPKS